MGLIHRDVKPENLLIGMNQKSSIIYLVDYGLSRYYRNPKTKSHISFRSGKSLTGTARYASLNTHLGYEQSRRDDLESVIYIMLYFLKGGLPWQGLGMMSKEERYEKIKQYKKYTPIEDLCKGYQGKLLVK